MAGRTGRGPGAGGRSGSGPACQRRAEQAARAGGERAGAGESPGTRRRPRPGVEPAGTCGRKGAGRRVEARPAAGLGDLPWRRPLALVHASARRVGTRPPPAAHGCLLGLQTRATPSPRGWGH